ncbi:twin-arginine translocation signal domain-containing protein [Jongsikchunia kroppenstedtii]|uniref:twin-arginine translocation signal domain-containing protein n=1 Tax=Jongsikchunia kroppenstedtii TaxID=1121721 RepID=UPI0003A57798|nr:twin-arginine translocation signal domain-containing protein [Jongsikchunia kroppenstedtii]
MAARSTVPRRPLSRRTFLSAASVGGLAVAGGLALSGCSDSAENVRKAKIEQLTPLWLDALADQSLARSLLPHEPDRTAALTVIANERGAHADALRAELIAIDSSRGKKATSAPMFTTPVNPTVASLRQQLTASAKRAGDLAVIVDGYRAGLCGSISAAVTTEVQVQLA